MATKKEEKQRVISAFQKFQKVNDPALTDISDSQIRRVLRGVVGTPGDEFSGPLQGLQGTLLINKAARNEGTIRNGLRILGGDNVHHIVPLALIGDALKDHPVDVQEEVLKMIVEEGIAEGTGNTSKNLTSLLSYTHYDAGDFAAHPGGDTVQKYLRPTPLPVGSSAKDIYESLKPTISTAVNQYNNAIGDGTVEAAKRKNANLMIGGGLSDPFMDLDKIKDPEELQGILKAYRTIYGDAEFDALTADPVGDFRSEVDPDKLQRYDEYQQVRLLKDEGLPNPGFGKFRPDAVVAGFDPSPSQVIFKQNISAWLQANGLESNRQNRQIAKAALQSEFNAAHGFDLSNGTIKYRPLRALATAVPIASTLAAVASIGSKAMAGDFQGAGLEGIETAMDDLSLSILTPQGTAPEQPKVAGGWYDPRDNSLVGTNDKKKMGLAFKGGQPVAVPYGSVAGKGNPVQRARKAQARGSRSSLNIGGFKIPLPEFGISEALKINK